MEQQAALRCPLSCFSSGGVFSPAPTYIQFSVHCIRCTQLPIPMDLPRSWARMRGSAAGGARQHGSGPAPRLHQVSKEIQPRQRAAGSCTQNIEDSCSCNDTCKKASKRGRSYCLLSHPFDIRLNRHFYSVCSRYQRLLQTNLPFNP